VTGGHPFARPLLFMLWALVFWGTLTLLSMGWRTVEIGLGDTLRLMLFGTPTVHPMLGRFSLVCAVIALGTWTAVAWVLLRGRSPVETERP
jgi:hypothetical protein